MRLKRSPFIALLILGIVVVSCGVLYLWLVNNSTLLKKPTYTHSGIVSKLNSALSAAPKEEPKVPSKLDGTSVPTNLAARHPLGVMIENHPEARPQSGLSYASVVYEAIAEGGITRFLSIFGPNDATKVGPVRSARPYYVDWCNEYDCYYAHVGGNYDALREKIPADNVKDLDQFANGKHYHRELKKNVALEHTMYSDTKTLYELAESKKWKTPLRDDYSIYSFLDDSEAKSVTVGSAASKIIVDFSAPQYKVEYTYNATDNNYARSLAGVPHVDAIENRALAPKNIIIQHISRSPITTKINESGWAMPTVGSGKAVIYQAGRKIEGTWKKASKYDRTLFMDDKGEKISLYRGQTWVEIVNPGSTVADQESTLSNQ